MRRMYLAAPALLLALGSTISVAQNATTSLRGTITDTSGAAIPNADITLKNSEVGTVLTAKANGHGEYSLQQIPPGKYRISIVSPGFATKEVIADLLVAQPATINARLSVTETLTVDVSGSAETLNTTDATIGNAINNETIMELPSEARNPQTLLALQPGVLYIGNTNSNDSRNGAVSGARPDQTNITLDGVDNNDQIAPSAFTGVLRTTLDSTEEFRVTTSNANADTGRSSGGQVNLVTRSGTNQYHGALYEYNRNSFGIANDWFNKNSELASGESNRPGKLIRNTYGARLGLPILKDKLFLFGNYEGDRIAEAASYSRTVPTDTFRAGTLQYIAKDGSTVALTPAQFASMDTQCTSLGTCPQGAGVNPSILSEFATYPHSNGFLSGDGYNTGSYTFSAASPTHDNVYIARLDYNPSDKHRFYVRGSFQNDTKADEPYYPGQVSSETDTDDSKGISVNYTYTISSNKVNNFRYGFVRQSLASTGAGQGSYVTLRNISLPEASTRSSSTVVPQHNFVDDFTWTKGKHTLQFGMNLRSFHYENSTNANSYDSTNANYAWMVNSGYVDHGGTFDPVANGFEDVGSSFKADYNLAATALAGLTNEETDNFNYRLSSDGTTGTLLGLGTPVSRNFATHELEYYFQDSFKPLPNLTLTAGIRHSILQTPYEVNGQQVQPTIDMHQWFLNRAAGMATGQSIQPEISFASSGQSRGGKPFFPMNWGNVAPRFALAYSPVTDSGTWINKIFGGAGQSSIRAGFGMYYDHFGEGLVSNYSKAGSFSLSTGLTNAASFYTADTSPRFTGLHNMPGIVSAPSSSISYPQTPSDDPNGSGFAITQGLDDHIKTPYSEVFNLSFQRELKGGFTFEADYVGRLGRHLLQQLDLAQPLNLVDPKSGMDYYTAGTMLSQDVDQGLTTVPSIAYFEDLFPDAAGVDTAGDGAAGNSATQNIYTDAWASNRGNETGALDDMDVYCYPGCGGQTGRYWPLQYSSLYVTASDGSSSYNAGQFILRHPMKHNIQLDLSYTYSKSQDLGSDTESNPTNTGYNFSPLLDAWNPRKNYGVSDFDTKHLFTADWVLRMPTGRGQFIGGNSGHLMNMLIGGWNLSGIARFASGLPFNVYDEDGWGTNWEYSSNMVNTGPVKMRKHQDANGSEQVFDDPITARANMRDPYPGEAGERNKFRGDGYFDVDMGLHKDMHLTERYSFKFAWEVFNVTNSARFDAHEIDTGSDDYTQLGVYSPNTLTQSRRMQLSGRFEF